MRNVRLYLGLFWFFIAGLLARVSFFLGTSSLNGGACLVLVGLSCLIGGLLVVMHYHKI